MTETMHTVLVVTGDRKRASKLACALSHPQIRVAVAADEKTIVSTLTGSPLGLAVVAGHVGRRGPLVLCDAVRARQRDLPVLVLVGQETDESELETHEERGLDQVKYLDLRGVSATMDELRSARILTLDMLGLPEDHQAAADWPVALAELQQAASQQATVQPQTAVQSQSATEPTSPSEPEPAPPSKGHATSEDEPEAMSAVPIIEPVTEEDLRFAERVAAATRTTDFRSPLPKTAAVDAGDKQVAKLRVRVRELERNIARLAHVYAERLREFDVATERVLAATSHSESLAKQNTVLRTELEAKQREWQAGRIDLEGKVSILTEKGVGLEARLQAAIDEVKHAREESQLTEKNHAAMLQQAQDAFATLKDSASRSLAQFDERSHDLETQLVAAHERTSLLEAQLDQARTQHQHNLEESRAELEQARARADKIDDERRQMEAELRQQLDDQQEQERIRQARSTEELHNASANVQALGVQLEALGQQLQGQGQELERTREELAESRSQMQETHADHQETAAKLATVSAQLDAAQHEIERASQKHQEFEVRLVESQSELKAARARHEEELSRQRSDREDSDQRWQEKANELKEAATTFRSAHEEKSIALAQRESELAEAKAEVKTATAEVARLTEQLGSLEEQRARALETVLDARLMAVEEVARSAGEKIENQHEMLTALDRRGRRQEQLFDILIGGSVHSTQPTDGGADKNNEPQTDEGLHHLARRLIQVGAHENTPKLSLWQGMMDSPLRIFLAFAAFLLTTAFVVWLWQSLGDDHGSTTTAPLVTAQTKPPTENDTQTPIDAAVAVADDENARDMDTQEDGETEAEVETTDPTPPAAANTPAKVGEIAGPPLPIELSEDERKELRKQILDSYKAKRWKQAADAGLKLQRVTDLGWELQLKVGESMRRTGDMQGTVFQYIDFVTRFPDNAFADDVALRAANLLVELNRKEEAIPILEKVAVKPKSRFRKEAQKRLSRLRGE